MRSGFPPGNATTEHLPRQFAIRLKRAGSRRPFFFCPCPRRRSDQSIHDGRKSAAAAAEVAAARLQGRARTRLFLPPPCGASERPDRGKSVRWTDLSGEGHGSGRSGPEGVGHTFFLPPPCGASARPEGVGWATSAERAESPPPLIPCHSSAVVMAFSPGIAPPERFRGFAAGSKPHKGEGERGVPTYLSPPFHPPPYSAHLVARAVCATNAERLECRVGSGRVSLGRR